MFGNRPLPNIAPSLLLFQPPPPDAFPAPPPLSSPSRAPAWAKQGRAHRRRPPTMPRHCDHHRLSTVPASAAPPLVEGCGRMTFATSPRHVTHRHRQSPLRATVERHVTANDNCPAPHHPTKMPAVERHVTKTEGARRRLGVGKGRRRGKEKKSETAGGEEGVCAPSPLQRHFRSQRGGVRPTRRLAWPPRCERVVCSPHTAPFKLFYPPRRLGGTSSRKDKNEAA